MRGLVTPDEECLRTCRCGVVVYSSAASVRRDTDVGSSMTPLVLCNLCSLRNRRAENNLRGITTRPLEVGDSLGIGNNVLILNVERFKC